MHNVTPHSLGFRMPARFDRHERTYICWPTICPQRNMLELMREDYAATVKAVARFEPVTLIVDPQDKASASAALEGIENVTFFECDLNDAWFRDSGPIFVRNDEGEVAMVNFRFNGWGGRVAADHDMAVGRKLAEKLGIKVFDAPFICEGGGLTVDGEGTLITTEQVMLNDNRYPGQGKRDIEKYLLDYLGITKVIWLKDGLLEDTDTDGHADNIVEYIAPGVVLAQAMSNPDNPNYEICRENLRRLHEATDAKGRKLKVIELDMLPYTREIDGLSMPVPYVNYYVVNDALIVPMLGGEDDEKAAEFLQAIYPEREIVGVPSVGIAMNGGGIACITQQHPVTKRH